MDNIETRYGASVDFSIAVDAMDAVQATLYVGKLGETPVISKSTNFVDGVAFLNLDSNDTKVPVDEYFYQVSVIYSGTNQKKKFPEASTCEDGELPKFIVRPALDEQEIPE